MDTNDAGRVTSGDLTLHFQTSDSLSDVATALAEGDHALGAEATAAGYAVVSWPGVDCPWFTPGPVGPPAERSATRSP